MSTRENLFKGLTGPLPERRSLGQYVYDSLKQAILKGDLAPGTRVVESQVAEAMGISRTPVREAIHKLEQESLLEHGLTGGFFVSGITRDEIEETFGIRSVLESYAARLAAVKHSEEELEPLEMKIREFQRCIENRDLSPLPGINTQFHDILYDLSRSPRLVKMINELREQIYRFREVILRLETMAWASNKDHRLMLEYIRKRDEEGVEKVVREHILRGQEAVFQEFEL